MIEYKLDNLSSSISNIKVTDYRKGEIAITYKNSDEVYTYSGLEMDKLVDLERHYQKLNQKKFKTTPPPAGYHEKWSIGKFINKEVANEDKYKVKDIKKDE